MMVKVGTVYDDKEIALIEMIRGIEDRGVLLDLKCVK